MIRRRLATGSCHPSAPVIGMFVYRHRGGDSLAVRSMGGVRRINWVTPYADPCRSSRDIGGWTAQWQRAFVGVRGLHFEAPEKPAICLAPDTSPRIVGVRLGYTRSRGPFHRRGNARRGGCYLRRSDVRSRPIVLKNSAEDRTTPVARNYVTYISII